MIFSGHRFVKKRDKGSFGGLGMTAGGVRLQTTTILNVILRPPKDLAVLSLLMKLLYECHPEASEGLGCSKLLNETTL